MTLIQLLILTLQEENYKLINPIRPLPVILSHTANAISYLC